MHWYVKLFCVYCLFNHYTLSMLQGCPVGEYLSVVNAECRVCPGNSVGTVSGISTCPCVEGYYRTPREEDRDCTSMLAQLLHEMMATHQNATYCTVPHMCYRTHGVLACHVISVLIMA